MTGREIEYPRYHRTYKDNTPILSVEHLTRKGQYEDMSLTVRPGDIIGLTGLLGSGRTELAMSLFGLNKTQAGVIKVNGKEVDINSPMVAKNTVSRFCRRTDPEKVCLLNVRSKRIFLHRSSIRSVRRVS